MHNSHSAASVAETGSVLLNGSQLPPFFVRFIALEDMTAMR